MGYAVMLLLVFLCHEVSSISILPHKHQTISLLKFKNTFTIDPSASGDCQDYGQKFYPKTSSWNMSRDCCSWDGVVCDGITGHVIELDLGCSGLVGTIDSNSSLFQLSHLQRLDLSFNNLSNSHISPEFGKFSSLKHLDLSQSYFSGQIPCEVSHLSKLHSLHLSTVPYSKKLRLTTHDFKLLLQNLTQLRELDLSLINISSTIPLNFSSHLTTLGLEYTQLYGLIPESIFHLPNLEKLSLAYNDQLSGHFPKIKWNSSASLIILDLRGVNFSDNLPEYIGYLTSVRYLFLSDCNLRGPIPESISNLTRTEYLDLFNNSLNGTIPSWVFSLPSLTYLDLGSNKFSGQLEDFKANSLIMLDLATNDLRGEIPQCLGNITSLQVLDMRHNNLSGNIPSTFINESSLRTLNLHGNKLEGKIPQSLTNCKQLEVLDLGDNHLNDTFPVWLGTLPQLKVLSLRFNKLHGPIRTSRIENMFPELRIIDLSYNAFSGNLPSSLFQHLKAMKTTDPSMEASRYDGGGYYQDSIAVVSKGYEREVVRILFLYATIDLSNNKFEGLIPTIMGDLIALRVLNISHNGLEGPIPSSLGSLSLVESLDLSCNHLVGEIPAQFASLTSLEVFNLSYNHFEGCIPQGNQFQTFESNSYEGNDGLRGFPITKSCDDDPASGTTYAVSGQLDDEESNSEFLCDFRKAALMGYGSGLCIGISIVYFMMSSGKPIWFARIIVELEHKIMMGRKKKQPRQRNCRRRNNH